MSQKEEKHFTTRRDFLKTTSLGTGAMVLGLPTFQSCVDQNKMPEEDDFFKGFMNPPTLARPFFRWWWNGNHISKEEVVRQLDIMKNAGIGGVEINPVAMPETAGEDPDAGLVWLSKEWCEMVKFAADEAKKRDMLVDLIVGTGWPFGGEFLEEDETIQGLSSQIIELESEGKQVIELPKVDGKNEKILRIALFPSGVGSIEVQKDLTDLPRKRNKIEVEVPKGDFRLHIVIWKNRFREVLHGAPGGAGAVLDHFNLEAVEKYLERISEALNPLFGGSMGKGIRSLFCDSIELEGANWTSDFPQEFEARRGYAIHEYLPLLIDKNFTPPTPFQKEFRKVQYDYSLTLAELFKERFIQPFHRWCNANGCQSRYQAYGYPWLYTDLLDGNLIPDIPEGDQWLFNNGWQNFCDVDNIRYAIWNKYASSAGHVKGRKIISTEAMTNTAGLFQTSLEYIKQATDLNFATGINHLILHGYNYSPANADFPGWIRYGTYFNEQNTWWPYMKQWTDYTARLSYVLQESKAVTQIALLGPTEDIWGKSGLDRTAFNFSTWYLHSFWQAFNHNGFMTDYVNGEEISRGIVKEGQLVCEKATFEALFVCDVINMKPDVAEKILAFARAGGKVFYIGSYPNKSPGIKDAEEQARWVRTAVTQTMESGGQLLESLPEDEKENQQELANWVRRVCKTHGLVPKVMLSAAHPKLFVNHRQLGDKEIVFFANMDKENHLQFEAQFDTGKKTPWKWNPETGERSIFPHNVSHILKIDLAPLESILLLFEANGDFKYPRTSKPIEIIDKQEIKTKWRASFQPIIAGEKMELEFEELIDLKEREETKYFSGTITYKTKFTAKEPSNKLLDLGEVKDIAEVTLNGQKVGSKWWGEKVFDISSALLEGENELEVKVTNLLYNYCCSLEDNPTVKEWRTRSRQVGLLSSGLIGPVFVY